jgi:hypothetical protein
LTGVQRFYELRNAQLFEPHLNGIHGDARHHDRVAGHPALANINEVVVTDASPHQPFLTACLCDGGIYLRHRQRFAHHFLPERVSSLFLLASHASIDNDDPFRIGDVGDLGFAEEAPEDSNTRCGPFGYWKQFAIAALFGKNVAV